MRSFFVAAIGAAAAISTIAVGCTTENAGAAGDAGADGGLPPSATSTMEGGTSEGGAAEAGTTGSLSCLGVLQCAGGCPDDNLDACVVGCVDRTSTQSKPVTEAFVQCLANKNCEDADCIRTNCKSELDACISDDASSTGAPSTGPTPTGAVPANLVGLWSQVGTSTGKSYEFAADGATIQVFKSRTSLYCDSEIAITSSGVTVVSGDSLVYHRAEGTQVIKSCGSTTGKPLGAGDIEYRYALGTFDDGTTKLSLYFVDNGTVTPDPLELHR